MDSKEGATRRDGDYFEMQVRHLKLFHLWKCGGVFSVNMNVQCFVKNSFHFIVLLVLNDVLLIS